MITHNRGLTGENISFAWTTRSGQPDYLFRNVSLRVREGEFVGIIGPSGCGKSTLLSIVAGLVEPLSGRIAVDGVPTTGPTKNMGLVPQDYSLFPWLTVRKNVEFGLSLHKDRFGGRAQWDGKVSTILKRVGLWEAREKYPHQLSGGMKQRTAIARVLANDSRFLLMDEPFGALDYQSRLHMQQFLGSICREFGKTVLFVTHHVDEAISLSDRVLLLSKGTMHAIEELPIALDHPRHVTDTAFNHYRSFIIEHLCQQDTFVGSFAYDTP